MVRAIEQYYLEPAISMVTSWPVTLTIAFGMIG